jgi:hypothetical protein
MLLSLAGNLVKPLISLYTGPERGYGLGRSQMKGGKNWILPKEINATGSCSETLIGWKSGKPLKSPMGPNRGSVAMDSASYLFWKKPV